MITSMAIAVNGQALRFFAVMHVNLWQVFVPGLLQSALVMSRFDKKKRITLECINNNGKD